MPDYKKDFPLLRDNQLVYLDNAGNRTAAGEGTFGRAGIL